LRNKISFLAFFLFDPLEVARRFISGFLHRTLGEPIEGLEEEKWLTKKDRKE